MTTTAPSTTAGRTGDRAEALAHRHGPTLARWGWAAKGVVYAVLGVLTLQLALGDRSESPDQQGAVQALADQTFGTVLLVLLVVGMAAYAVGRWLEASVLAEPDLDALDRLRMIGSGIFYAGLAVFTVQLLMGETSGGGGGRGGGGGAGSGGAGGGSQTSARSVTAGVLEHSWGRWLVGAVGLAFLAAGVFEAYRGVTKQFMESLETGEMSARARRLAERVGMAGLVARAIAWSLVGWFLLQAAIQFDPSEAKGLDQALRSVADEPWGTALLLVVALGFVAYGAYCAVQSRYHRVGTA
ncbi:MAG TPA: DUF1206 domain-containing protein [Acidimicrobiales bacterium]|nr:DUF1206 domain-containing protein [Acidimicrobiales bacterium]